MVGDDGLEPHSLRECSFEEAVRTILRFLLIYIRCENLVEMVGDDGLEPPTLSV